MANNEKKSCKIMRSDFENKNRERLQNLYSVCPVPAEQFFQNLGLFLNRQTISRLLWLQLLYTKIINVHGVIMDFGVRWGQTTSYFTNFRGVYEPFNYTRKIIGFDTFSGFPKVHANDGQSDVVKKGAYDVTLGYEDYLEQLLDYHENESPIPHIKKHEIIKGDAIYKLRDYLKSHPETIIALAYFDFDLYEPTLECLKMIVPHLTIGSIIGFDELCHSDFPGETIALKEALGSGKYSIKRVPWNPTTSYIEIDHPI